MKVKQLPDLVLSVFRALNNQNSISISQIFNETINFRGSNIDIVVPSQNTLMYEKKSITISGTHTGNSLP